jgi:tetratricopeptide (TPR) repeat protein
MSDHQPNDSNIDPDAETLETAPEESSGRIPKKIGDYKIIRTIGSGGMGTVYEGIQENPKRKVAIKVMRSGVSSRSAMRRFEYESQVLGRLSHPAIAKVFEAGKWDDGTGGVPYFAMEYIPGANGLLDYAKRKNLHTTAKLELFTDICDAVHHGHLKGIIHRDLKPDNLLVDHAGNPKIIDFGVARATDSDIAITTLQTNVGQLVGTVQYMSPEQCEADPDLIDARSDVYSLGVILYELLTGQLPYDLSGIPIYEATRLIREQQPTRMTTISDGIAGDLETIVGKAMDKDCDRRYQSASELLQDIHRFIENEPIHARSASMAYQLKLFAKRNRGVVATVMAIGIALVFATIVSVLSSIRASTAEQTAIADRDRAVDAEEVAKKHQLELLLTQEQMREEQEVIIKYSSEMERMGKALQADYEEMQKMMSLLSSAGKFNADLLSLGAPRNAKGKRYSVRDILIYATEIIPERFGGKPLIEAPIRSSVGQLLWELGETELARVQLERSLELHKTIDDELLSRDHWKARNNYAKVLLDLGDYVAAKEVANSIIEEATAEFGGNSWRVLEAKDVLAGVMLSTMSGDFLQLRREIVEAIQSGAKVKEEFDIKSQISLAEALLYMHSIAGRSQNTQAYVDEASAVFEPAIQLAEETLGLKHPVTLQGYIVKSGLLFLQYQIHDAIPLLESTLESARLIFGDQHIKTASIASSLGTFLYYVGRTEEAEQLLIEADGIFTKAVTDEYIGAVQARCFLAKIKISQEKYAEAEQVLRKSIAQISQTFNEPTIVSLDATGTLAHALMMQGKFEEGGQFWDEVMDFILSSEGGETSESAHGMRYIRVESYVLNNSPKAKLAVDELFKTMFTMEGRNITSVLVTANAIASNYVKAGSAQEGIVLLESIITKAREFVEENDRALIAIQQELALMQFDNGLFSNAREILTDIIPKLQIEYGLFSWRAVYAEILIAKIDASIGNRKRALVAMRTLQEKVDKEVEDDSIRAAIESELVDFYIAQDAWHDVDSIMDERLHRYHDDADALLFRVNAILNNKNEEYKSRYFSLALQAANRALVLRGESDPETTFALGLTLIELGQKGEALNWLAKAVAFAGEDHENIDTYRAKLEEVSAKMKEPVQQ